MTMHNVRSAISRTLTSCNKVVDKNASIYLTKSGFVNSLIHHGAVFNVPLTCQHLPRLRNTHLNNCFNQTNPSKQSVLLSEKDQSSKYKVCQHGHSEMSVLFVKKQSTEDEELLDMFGSAVRDNEKQFADNLLYKPEMKTKSRHLSKNTLSVVSSSQDASVICGDHCFVSSFSYGFRHCSVDLKHRSNNVTSSVKFRPAVIKQCPMLPAVLKSSSLLSFISDKYSLRYISRTFSSSSSLMAESVDEKSDRIMNTKLDGVNSVKSGGLHMSDDKCELNDEQKVETNYSDNQETSPVKSVYINKELRESTENVRTCESPGVSNLSDLEFNDVKKSSSEFYDDLYLKLMNAGNQALTKSSSDLSNQETTMTSESYEEKYSKLMKAVKTDEEEGEVSKGKLTHTDSDGKAVMVDVGDKTSSLREARAEARIYLGPEAARLVKENKMKKGDVLTVAQIAGIMAAKQTAQLIPLCHNINLTKADVVCVLNEKTHSVDITSYVRTVGVTGVEMEALTAASIAALTVYDMCKAVTHDMDISDVRLLSKSGGKRNFQR